MPALVSNAEAEASLRRALGGQGFSLNEWRRHGETGVDILATKDGETWHIEVIGFKSSPPARAMDFYQSFFRAVSRLNDDAKHCVVAVPKRFALGLPRRAAQHAVAWDRIADAFPELEVWLIDADNDEYSKTTWRSWSRRRGRIQRELREHEVQWNRTRGERLKGLREKLGLSLARFGAAVGCSGSRIYEIERAEAHGRPTGPSPELFANIVEFLKEYGDSP